MFVMCHFSESLDVMSQPDANTPGRLRLPIRVTNDRLSTHVSVGAHHGRLFS